MSRPLVTWHLGIPRRKVRKWGTGAHGRRITGAGATRGRMISEAGKRQKGRGARMTASHLPLRPFVLLVLAWPLGRGGGGGGISQVNFSIWVVTWGYVRCARDLMLMARTREGGVTHGSN